MQHSFFLGGDHILPPLSFNVDFKVSSPLKDDESKNDRAIGKQDS